MDVPKVDDLKYLLYVRVNNEWMARSIWPTFGKAFSAGFNSGLSDDMWFVTSLGW